jgi:folate-binding protein YgfZ
VLEIGGARALLLPLAFGRRAALHVLAESQPPAQLLAAITQVGEAWTQVDLDAARVAEGVPAAGSELDERILPNEARLEDAVSYAKGCFPGQEPVVMARDRGHPPTLLVRLTLETPARPLAGTALLDGERAVGRLTTVAPGRDGRSAALGFVRHALARAGQRLAVAGGGTAEVL